MNGHPGDLRLAREESEEARHRGYAVDHPLVHADVDDVGAALDLLAGDADRLLVLALLDELGELRRAGDVRALADHDVDALLLRERLRARRGAAATEARARRPAGASLGVRDTSRGGLALERLGDGLRCAPGVLPQQPPGDVDEPRVGELAEVPAHVGRSQVEARRRERVRQPGVRVAGDGRARLLRELGQERVHEVRAERAVEPDRERLHVLHRVPEAPRPSAPRSSSRRRGPTAAEIITGRTFPSCVEDLLDRDERRLGVERVEDRLDEQHVRRRPR